MSNQLLEAALEYAKQGWPIFPCSATKEPLIDGGVTMATTDAAKIREWWERFPRANIGLDAGGAGFMVFDFDPGSDKAAFAKTIGGEAPETGLRARTPRGGDHWYYQLGDGETVPMFTAKSQKRGEPKFSAHVDVRSFHSYVLLPPSRTADGVYEWASFDKPAHRTDEMYRVAHLDHRERSTEHDTWIIDADMPENIAAAVEWLKHKAEPAVKGSGGNHAAYGAAAMCKSYGLSGPTAFEVLWEHWGPRCTPQWYSPESLETCIDHAYRYNTSPPGNMTTAYKAAKSRELFKPVVREDGTREPYEGRFQVSTVLELESRPEPKWLLDEVIPERGYAILYGPPGAFKTFLALDMALSIAHWQPWHSRAVNPGRVLYCLGEGAFDVDKRIRAWLAHNDCTLDPEAFKVIEPAPLVKLETDKADFIKAAAHFGPWDLVVVDTVGRVMAGLDDNSALGARMFTEFATDIRLHLGAATLAITHAPKDRPEVLLGSGAYEADADCIYNATIASKGDTINLRQHKIKYGAPWEKQIGFRKLAAGQSMVLQSCAPAKTVKDKERAVESNHGAQFLIALAKRKEATWPDIKAAMCAMNEVAAADQELFKGRLDNWFKRWSRSSEFITGEKSANNSHLLRMPT